MEYQGSNWISGVLGPFTNSLWVVFCSWRQPKAWLNYGLGLQEHLLWRVRQHFQDKPRREVCGWNTNFQPVWRRRGWNIWDWWNYPEQTHFFGISGTKTAREEVGTEPSAVIPVAWGCLGGFWEWLGAQSVSAETSIGHNLIWILFLRDERLQVFWERPHQRWKWLESLTTAAWPGLVQIFLLFPAQLFSLDCAQDDVWGPEQSPGHSLFGGLRVVSERRLTWVCCP